MDFLIDGGAVVSVVPLHIVKYLGKEEDSHPTNKTLRYGGGKIDIPVAVIKLKLKFSEEVVILHTFCVTKNPSTPLILGMDFLLSTNSIQDPHLCTLTFRTIEDGKPKLYVIYTQEGDGIQEESNEVV